MVSTQIEQDMSPPGSRRGLFRRVNRYRLITGIAFIVATIMMWVAPLHMPDPDDWAYYLGVRNFSEGRFTVTNYEQMLQAREVEKAGNFLLQYLPVEFNKWALEKAPGVVFYLVPFYKIGVPRLGNVVLALGMVIVTYLLLKRLRDEKAAMLGSLLMLFTPIALVMFNRLYMDTYASLAFLVIGGGLYLYYHLERDNLSTVTSGILLFLAVFFTGWSVVTRYTNLLIAIILALHYITTRIIDWRRGRPTHIGREILPVFLGIGLPVAALLLYDNFVFGSPLTYGYAVSPYPINFAFQYIGQVYDGESIPSLIFRYNIPAMARNAWIGFPLLVIGIPGFIWILYRAFVRPRPLDEQSTVPLPPLPWDILLVLTGWFVSVFVLYLGYEWTAGLKIGGGFVIFDRFLLPGLFPVVVVCGLVLARFTGKVTLPIMVVLVVFGSLLYAQWAWSLHVLPHQLTERTLESRWPGYIFPPWVEWEYGP